VQGFLEEVAYKEGRAAYRQTRRMPPRQAEAKNLDFTERVRFIEECVR